MTIAREGRHPLFRSEAERIVVVRDLCRRARSALLLFCMVDDHLHMVIEGSHRDVGHFTAAFQQHLRPWLRWRDHSRRTTQPAHIEAVEGRAHLKNLVTYTIRQPVRHKLGVPPAIWRGSCLTDLIGARQVHGFDPHRLRAALPRLPRETVWKAADLPILKPVSMDAHDGFTPRELTQAAFAAHAAVATDSPQRPERMRAVHAALALLQFAGIAPSKAAKTLRCSARTVQRHRATSVVPGAFRAPRLQLAILAYVRKHISGPLDPDF